MSYKDADKSYSKLELFCIFVACSLLIVPVFRSGSLTDYGLSFWGPNGHDAVFHLALIRSMYENFSLGNPMFSGGYIQNYHLGFDLIVSTIYGITKINIYDLFFRWIPIFLSLMISFGAIRMMKTLGFSKGERIMGLFGLTTLGSLGFVIGLSRGDIFAGESLFWANQSASMLLNPPFALSLVGLFFWINTYTRNKGKMTWLLFLLPSLLFHIKAYAGLLLIGAISLEICYRFFVIKAFDRKLMLMYIASLIVFGLSTGLVLSNSSLISFEPLWFVKQMISSTDRLYIPRVASAYDNWLTSGSLVRLSFLQIVLSGIFLLGNFGIRILGLLGLGKNIDKAGYRLVAYIVLLGTLVPFFFIQKGTPWNTIQFIYYPLALAGILAGKFIANRIYESRNIIQLVAWFILFFAGTLTTWGTLRDYVTTKPASYVSHNEIEVLSYKDEGMVITRPFESTDKRRFTAPLPLYVYESTGYIPMLGNLNCYLCDQVNLTIMDYHFDNRVNISKTVFGSDNQLLIKKLLKQNDIEYIYVDPISNIRFDPGTMSYRMIASSGGFRLWQKIK